MTPISAKPRAPPPPRASPTVGHVSGGGGQLAAPVLAPAQPPRIETHASSSAAGATAARRRRAGGSSIFIAAVYQPATPRGTTTAAGSKAASGRTRGAAASSRLPGRMWRARRRLAMPRPADRDEGLPPDQNAQLALARVGVEAQQPLFVPDRDDAGPGVARDRERIEAHRDGRSERGVHVDRDVHARRARRADVGSLRGDAAAPDFALFQQAQGGRRRPAAGGRGEGRRDGLDAQVLDLAGDQPQTLQRQRVAFLPDQGPDLLELRVESLRAGGNGGERPDQQAAADGAGADHARTLANVSSISSPTNSG